jgi:hypothetical protein
MGFRSFAKGKRFALIGLALSGVSIPMLWVVPLIGVAGIILTFLLLVARYDNDLGSFLPIAVLFVIVILIMVLLIGALAYVHALVSGFR